MHRLSHVFGLTLLLGVVSLAGAQDADLPWRSRDCNVHWSGCNWMWLNTHIQAWLTGPDGNDPGPDGASHFKVQNDSKYPCYVSGTAIGIGTGSAAGLVEAGRTRLISLAIPHDKDHPITLITVSFKWVDEAAAEEAARQRAEAERKRQEEEKKKQEEQQQRAEAERQRRAEETRRQAEASAQQAAAQRERQAELTRQILQQSQQRLQSISQAAEALAQLITGNDGRRPLTGAALDAHMDAVRERSHQTFELQTAGDALYEMGDLGGALAKYNAALALSPDSDDAYAGRGRVMYERGDYEHALTDFAAAIKRTKVDVTLAQYYWRRGQAYYQLRKYDRCVQDCDAAIKRDPKGEYGWLPQAHSTRGLARAAQGQMDLALTDLDTSVRLRPTQSSYLNRARCHLLAGRYGDAVTDCSAVTDAYRASKDFGRVPHEAAEAYYMRGVARLLAGDAAEAKRDALRSRWHGTANDWFELYAKVGMPCSPNQAQAEGLITLGTRVRDNGDHSDKEEAQARAMFAKAAELWPTSALPHLCHATVVGWPDDSGQYGADLNAAVRADPDCALARMLRVEAARYGRAPWDDVVSDATRLMELDPELVSSATYCTRGDAWLLRGNREAALSDFAAAVKLDATYAPAHFRRGETLRQQGQLNDALVELSEAIRLSPDYFFALGSRGAVYLAKGDVAHALADLEQALTLRPKYAWAQYVRAAVRLRQGDRVSALLDATAAKQQGHTDDWLQVYQTLGL